MRDTRNTGWGRTTLAPSRPTPSPTAGPSRGRPPQDVSPPLMRVGGTIGFCLAGLGTVYGGGRLLGIDAGVWNSGHLPGKAVGLLAVAFVVGLFGMLVGAGLGATLSVRSPRQNHVISVLWHHLANGSLTWIMLVGLALTIVYGKAGAKQYLQQFGMGRACLLVLGVAAGGSLLVGASLLTRRLVREDGAFVPGPVFVRALLIGLGMGYAQFALLGTHSRLWIAVAVVWAVLTVLMSLATIERDRRQRVLQDA